MLEPATGQLLATVGRANAEDVAVSAEIARAAQKNGPPARHRSVRRFSAAWQSYSDDTRAKLPAGSSEKLVGPGQNRNGKFSKRSILRSKPPPSPHSRRGWYCLPLFRGLAWPLAYRAG